MQPQMTFETSPTTEKLDTALAKAQAKVTNAKHNSTNPHFQKTYADLSAVWEACRAPLAEAGVSLTQWPMVAGNQVSVLTRVAHAGEWMQCLTTFPASRTDVQGIMGTITYLKRAALGAIVGVAADGEDDDGEGAVGRGKRGRGDSGDNQGREQEGQRPQGTGNRGSQGQGPSRAAAPASGPKPHVKAAPPLADAGTALVPFGDCAGRTLESLSDDELKSLAGFYDNIASKKQEPKGKAKEFQPLLNAFLDFKFAPAHKAPPAADPAKAAVIQTKEERRKAFLAMLAQHNWTEAQAKEWLSIKYSLGEGAVPTREQMEALASVVQFNEAKAAIFMLQQP